MIEFKGASKSYDNDQFAVKDLNFKVNTGELVAIIGPSGCGKTTSLKMINRLIEPTEGKILIDDEDIKNYDIHELRWNIGYVLQQIALFPNMTIEQNIKVVPDLKRWNDKRKNDRVRELMDMIGLEPDAYLKRYPSELSGGQQQRIGVIRALAADPNIVLMDEPFSALDPISRKQLQADVSRLQQEIKKTIVFVTHDIKEAAALADRICLMKNGKLEQFDTPDNMMASPANDFVLDFIGDIRSPWMRSAGTYADYSAARPYMQTEEGLRSGNLPEFAIVTDEEEVYKFMIINGKRVDHEPIQSVLPLDEAYMKMKESNLLLYPIIEEGKLTGVISERSILDNMQNKEVAGVGE